MISWSQTEIDGLSGAPVSALRRGVSWQWRGEAVCLDAAAGFGHAISEKAAHVMRRHAVARAREILSRALAADDNRPTPESRVIAQSVTLTDGPRRWIASLIDVPGLVRPILMFLGGMPPRGVSLRVAISPERPDLFDAHVAADDGVVCFVGGTRLETPHGAALVEEVVAGDRVVTKDGGAREVLWVGRRHISRARLLTTPDLRPVRIAAGAVKTHGPSSDLLVSPDHRMLVETPQTRDRLGEPEVLVAARDLVGRPGVTRDLAQSSVTYYHIMLAEHGIVLANGVETESFHPAAAQLYAIAEDQRARLFDLMPNLATQAANYGPPARRVLNGSEAALLTAAS